MSDYIIHDTTLTSIADAIRTKTGTSAQMTPSEMATAIGNISTGGGGADIVPQTITYTNNISYHFAYDKYKWLIENYDARLQFDLLTNLNNAFTNCSLLPTNDLNVSTSSWTGTQTFTGILMNDNTGKSVTIPYIKGTGKIGNSTALFQNSHITIPNDWFDYIKYPNYDSDHFSTSLYGMFDGAIIHQTVDMYNSALVDNQKINNGRYVYNVLPFNYIYSQPIYIDGLINIPVGSLNTKPNAAYTMTWPAPVCKRLTFQMNNNVPFHANWHMLILDFSKVGYEYSLSAGYVSSQLVQWYGQGNGTENAIRQHEITDATSAANLANDPWRWSRDVKGSLYNKTSALETIASLPDLTTSNSTATIIFSGDAGAFTSGGAISSMTSDEIAVATNKGWTVQLV